MIDYKELVKRLYHRSVNTLSDEISRDFCMAAMAIEDLLKELKELKEPTEKE